MEKKEIQAYEGTKIKPVLDNDFIITCQIKQVQNALNGRV